MRILITGATGLVGRRLTVDRLERGDQVVVLSRSAERAERLFAAHANPNVTVVEGNPAAPGAWQDRVDGCDAVVHLAGAGIADRRWSKTYKKELVQSRIDSTHQVVSAMTNALTSPRVLVCASAIGYYGDTGSVPVDEAGPAADDFLGDLCVRWEEQAQRAEEGGARVVRLRVGIVLDSRGGALEKMARPFKFFMGGHLGDGHQYVSWIHWRDLIGLIDLALREASITGPMNGTAPNPVTARELSHVIGQTIGRPSWLPVPRMMLRMAVGPFADFMLASQRVMPSVAQRHGYTFVHQEIEPALASLFRDSSPTADGEPGTESGRVVAAEPPASATEIEPPAPVRLVALAVDGTLLRSDGRIPQGVVQACRAAERAGCVIVIATTRPPRAVRPILRALDVMGPAITYQGALIWNPVDERPQYHESLSSDVARAIVHDAREMSAEIALAVEVLDRCLTDRVDPLLDAARFLEPDATVPLEEMLQEQITRVTLLGAPGVISDVAALIRERYWQTEQVAMFSPEPQAVQITSRLVDKSIALQRIAQRLNADRAEVMAIGDGVNDLGMLEWAGFGVAVANALPAVRKIADAIVPSNDDLGVARAIQRYVLSG